MPICHVPCVPSVAPCVGRCVVTWGLQAWAPWGWDGMGGHSRKGLEMPLCPALVCSHQRNLQS